MAQIARVEPNPNGLYECVHCGDEYADPMPAGFCCDDEYEHDH